MPSWRSCHRKVLALSGWDGCIWSCRPGPHPFSLMVYQARYFTPKEVSDRVTLSLSLLLFVIVVDLLQSILNKDKNQGLLRLPIQQWCGQDFLIVQYWDDTILIMEACQKQLFFLKAILNSFAVSIGLKVNYHKSNIYPVNVSALKIEVLSKSLECSIGTFPFTYLGLPMRGWSTDWIQHHYSYHMLGSYI